MLIVKNYAIVLFVVATLFNTTLVAAPKNPTTSTGTITKEQTKNVEAALEKVSKVAGKHLTATSIKTTPIPGLLQVTTDLSIIYVSANGQYIISGEMIDLNKPSNKWSLTEMEMRKIRQLALAGLDSNDMIIYPAKGNKIGSMTVFTDIDCPYCKKLQDNLSDYTDKGIEVRYVAFPRQGPGSKGFEKAITVWCSTDRNKAYTDAVDGKDLPSNQCKNNMVAEQFDLGRRIGVTGTPTMVFDNGIKVGGLISAEDAQKIMKE